MCFSQQDAQFSLFMYNQSVYNPAYIGSNEDFNIYLQHSNQWIGFEGAPITNVFSANGALNLKENLHLGINFYNDLIGATTENNLSIDFAYSIYLGLDYKLSFGLKASGGIYNLDTSKLNIFTPNDVEFQNLSSKFNPNIGAGLFLYKENFYLGIGVPTFIGTNYFDNSNLSVATRVNHYYLNSGYVFTKGLWKYKPNLVSKFSVGSPIIVDLNFNVLYNNFLTAGLSYRTNNAVSGLLGIYFNKNWFFGYSYDYETNNLRYTQTGTHGAILKYSFKRRNRITSPRFF